MATIFMPSGRELPAATVCTFCGELTNNPKTAARPGSSGLVCERHLATRSVWLQGWLGSAPRTSKYSAVKANWLDGCQIEHRSPYGDFTITVDLSRHVYARSFSGSVLIVTDNVLGVLSQLHRRWLEFQRLLTGKAARTLTLEAKRPYLAEVERLSAIRIARQEPAPSEAARIVVVEPGDLPGLLLPYSTVYLTCGLQGKRPQSYILAPGALVVDYTKRIARNA